MSNPPKFNLNEYFKQIKLILEESTTKENATHDINKILNNYFLDFNSQISIAQTALLMKVYENIFSPQSKEKSIKDNLTDIGYHLSDFTKEFFAVSFFLTNTFSACFPKLINKVINPKDIKEIGSLKLSDQHNLIDNMWSDEIALSSLESLVSKYLMNNKVKAEYESLSAELKNEKKPIVRLKFMPKIKDNTIQEAEKNKRTKI
jgi:hypothetical protein